MLVCLDVTTGVPPQQVKISEAVAGTGRVLQWETVAGRRYLLVRREADLKTWRVVRQTPEPRRAPRNLKQAKLGRDRLF
jgi:hypothetical protein